jgi:hypothetical protein
MTLFNRLALVNPIDADGGAAVTGAGVRIVGFAAAEDWRAGDRRPGSPMGFPSPLAANSAAAPLANNQSRLMNS